MIVLLSTEQFEHNIIQILILFFLVLVCHFCDDQKDKLDIAKSVIEQNK